MFGKYNILTIFSKSIENYGELFAAHDIQKVENLITAWDTFSQDHPGQSERYTFNGKDVFSIPNQFKDWGIYLAEQRENSEIGKLKVKSSGRITIYAPVYKQSTCPVVDKCFDHSLLSRFSPRQIWLFQA